MALPLLLKGNVRSVQGTYAVGRGRRSGLQEDSTNVHLAGRERRLSRTRFACLWRTAAFVAGIGPLMIEARLTPLPVRPETGKRNPIIHSLGRPPSLARVSLVVAARRF